MLNHMLISTELKRRHQKTIELQEGFNLLTHANTFMYNESMVLEWEKHFSVERCRTVNLVRLLISRIDDSDLNRAIDDLNLYAFRFNPIRPC